ncbi:MAG TPA: hypothetical protein VFE24_16220 [Pirellulales bacterium]|jgi:hypothetical protein|nr:hypothetical protein [Pirellulales bacterium]
MRTALAFPVVALLLLLPRVAEAKAPDNRPEIIVQGDWKGASHEDIQQVLRSVADQLMVHCPARRLNNIIVTPCEGVPISLFKKGPHGEYQVMLSARGTFWAQYAYQFAHEMCHLLCNYDQRKTGKNLWFEECLCETSSLFVLGQLPAAWDKEPPYANWKSFAPAFAKYRAELLQPPERKLPENVTLNAWLNENLPVMRDERELTERSKRVAAQLVPLFDAHPEGWETLIWINRGENDADAEFKAYLQSWHDRLPAGQRPFVERLQAAFGFDK